MATVPHREGLRAVLLGTPGPERTRALLLAAGLFTGFAAGNALALTVRAFVIWRAVATRLIHYPFLPGLWVEVSVLGVDMYALVIGLGLFLFGGLALITGYRTGGYLPSLAVAAGPGLGYYLVTIDGPTTPLVVSIHDNLVIAPTWAVLHLGPDVIVFGTAGFLLGWALRRRVDGTSVSVGH